MTDDPWLSPRQQEVWRRWIALSAVLPATLNRQLQDEAGLSLGDYDVLVALSESGAQRLRVGDLASALTWERSRLSHHLRRMEKRGLVTREDCEDDGRGAWSVISPTGLAAISESAPSHARFVRELFFDDLTTAELDTLDALLGDVLERVSRPGAPGTRRSRPGPTASG